MKFERLKRVGFVESDLKKAFKKLQNGKTDEKKLAEYIDRAMDDLEKDEQAGLKISSQQWPKEYIRKYKITNLRKYDLPNGWRLIYTIRGNNIEIISVLLEWVTHKNYERKFGYKRS
jgi:hypothetical protein